MKTSFSSISMGVRKGIIRAALTVLICELVIAKKDRLKFIVVGDSGGMPWKPYTTFTQRSVSRHMSKVPGVDFIVGLGDNFYYEGVRSLNDHRFVATFEDAYSSPQLQKDWYMIAGNHDHYSNVSAQIMYTKKSKRWKFPHYFYTKVFQIPRSNKTLQIVMLDTTILCPKSIAPKKHAPLPKTQMQWITHTLENSKADYLIVGGHHPMYSAGWHGPTQCIRKKLENLFKKYRVTAYFSGHDHNLQHIVPENSLVEHFVSGAGNFVNGWKLHQKILANTLKKFIGNSGGFLVLTATDRNLKVNFHTVRRGAKYHQILHPRQHQSRKLEYSQLLKHFFSSTKTKGYELPP